MDAAEQKTRPDGYLVPTWLIRWAVPAAITAGALWMTKMHAEVTALSGRTVVLETRGSDIERRLDRIERQNDDIKSMLQLMVERERRWQALPSKNP